MTDPQPPRGGFRPPLNGRPMAATTRGAPQAPGAPAPTPAMDLSKFVDVHIVCGLQDEICRLRQGAEGFGRILNDLVLGRQDLVLRGQFEEFERTIVLRGDTSFMFSSRKANAKKKLPLYNVYTVDQLMEIIAQQAEHARSRAPTRAAPVATSAPAPGTPPASGPGPTGSG